jgi:predicted O-methyltransferase YrrM
MNRSIYALFGIRPVLAQHSRAEGELLREYACGAKTLVEIGVAEGGSAWETGQVMAQDGNLYLIDPYPHSRAGQFSPTRLVAHRLITQVARGHVTWIEEFSQNAADGWSTPIDFLFIDGDHSYEGVKADWDAWTPHLATRGHVALHDARIDGAWIDHETGPVRLVLELGGNADWITASAVDTLVVLKRS